MRLLVVEDDETLGKNLKVNLTQKGFAVDIAADGIEGEFMGNEEPYDLGILDLGLPHRSGTEVLKNWRLKNNHVPVIILTARDSWQEKVEGLKAGADDYLAKPFHMEELLARINAMIRRNQEKVGGRLNVGEIILDEDRQTVELKEGKTFELTGNEFRLLRFFMFHPNQILSKTRIIEHVYDFNFDKDSNLIEVYVNRLRQKIGKDRIQTRLGQGYIFRSPN